MLLVEGFRCRSCVRANETFAKFKAGEREGSE